MSNKIKFLLIICLTLISCLAVHFIPTKENATKAAEILTPDWILETNPSKLTVSGASDGGVATVSYTSLSSTSAENTVTLKVSNYDVNDNRLSIKYNADFPVSGSNIQIEISYSSGSDENTGEDYDGGKVLTGWFENWNVENGKTRDGYDLITMDFSSYVGGKTINGVVFTFAYAGDSSTTKTINFLGVDFHPEGVTPQFVTDGPIAEGSIYIEKWVPDAEIGNMNYSTTENGDTTIHYDSTPNGKSRIVAPLKGHDATLFPTLKVKYSCTKDFNLAIYINGTSTSLLSYTNITDNEGELTFSLDKTMEKLCIIVDRSNYCDKSTYTSEDPTKDIYLQFYFVDQEGNEYKVHSVAGNNGENSGSGSGNESGGGNQGGNTGGTTSGDITIGEWVADSGLGNMEFWVNEEGQLVVYYAAAPTGKGRIYAAISGHSFADYPTLQITYSCSKSFNLAVYKNGDDESILSKTHITDNNGVITIDIGKKSSSDLVELWILVDRKEYHDASTYTDEDPTKTVYLEFAFLDASGNAAGSGDNNQGGSGSGSGSTTPPATGDVIFGSWQNEAAGNMQYSVNEDGQTVIYFDSAPTSKSRIYATVTGHTAASYSTLQIKYSCSKEFNFAVYINGTSTSILSYEDITDNEGVLLLDITADVNEIYIMVDRSGRENPDSYTGEDPTKTVYLEFEFLPNSNN